MQFKKVILGTVTILVTVTGNFTTNLLVPFSTAEVLAQTQTREERRQEALRLSQLGFEQFDRGKYIEALKTFQKVLLIVREIEERRDEGATLYNFTNKL
jgi:Tfp pilus assembly protein PilF